MRTTVGPLPAAVYWRRRLAVLAALFVLILGVVFACSGSDDENAGQRGTGAVDQVPTSETPSEDVLAPEVDESFEASGPPTGPDTADVPAGPVEDPSVVPTAVVPEPTGACTDDEIRVTPVPMRKSAKRGEPIDLRLRIRNVGQRTCARDVGADLQEIYIKQGAAKIWSSDACGLAKGSDVQQFPPNHEREYRVTWNGRTSSRCAGGAATGPAPAAGAYQVFGRLGAKVSAPVAITVSA